MLHRNAGELSAKLTEGAFRPLRNPLGRQLTHPMRHGVRVFEDRLRSYPYDLDTGLLQIPIPPIVPRYGG